LVMAKGKYHAPAIPVSANYNLELSTMPQTKQTIKKRRSFLKKSFSRFITYAINKISFANIAEKIACSQKGLPFLERYKKLPLDWQNTEEINRIAVDLTMEQIQREGETASRGEIETLIQEIAIQYNIPDKITVYADSNMLAGIMRNLLSNAVKFTPLGGAIIVSAKPLADSVVEISVKDTGIGMSADLIANLFRLDANTSRKGTAGEPSTGLGLILCKDFIEKHNGEFRFESEPGIGSTVYFTLSAGNGAMAKKIDTIDVQPEKDARQVKKLKILIAEDDETSDILLTLALKKYCNEFLHANTGLKAIELVSENPDIDVVLMDVKMPEMDGYEAARQIRTFNKDIIIIAQTAYVNESEHENAAEAGCNGYISKPIHLAELILILENCLKNRK